MEQEENWERFGSNEKLLETLLSKCYQTYLVRLMFQTFRKTFPNFFCVFIDLQIELQKF